MTAEQNDESVSKDIEGALLEGIDDDPRLGNGVPHHLRGSDLDFIQMSGLTVPAETGQSRGPAPDDDMDPNVPVSFYEEGVDDVDSRRAPLGTEPEAGSADEVIVAPKRTSVSTSIQSLKEIVADLTSPESPGRSRSTAEPSRAQHELESLKIDLSETSGHGAEETHDEVAAYVEDIVVPDDEPIPNLHFPEQSSPIRDLGPLPSDGSITPDVSATDNPLSDSKTEDPVPPPSRSSASESDVPASGLAASGLIPSEPRASEPGPETVETVSSQPEIDDTPYAAEVERPATRRTDLAHAESLLQRLESRTGGNPGVEPLDEFEIPEIPEAEVHDQDFAESDESVYNRPMAPSKRRGRRRRSRRRLFRWFALVILLAALGVGGYYTYDFVREQTASEGDTYQTAARLAERGRHAEAAAAFAAFASRYPDGPLTGDALLMAAQSYEHMGDEATAIRFYEAFRSRFPKHPKFNRATTLLALADVRNHDYETAITLLQDPERRTLDPDGYLASLRALGEAHAALGQIDEARSAYLRAASLEGNYTADEDYLALATLYQSQAETAKDEGSRRRFLSLAVDQWDFAMRSPGITESRRREIKARRELVVSQLGGAASRPASSDSSPSGSATAAPDAGVKAGDATADELSENPGTAVDMSGGQETEPTRNYDEEQAKLMDVD